MRGPTAAAALAGIEAVVALRDVDDDGNAAGLRDRLERRDERRGGNHDLGARLDADRHEPEAQRVEPAGDADAMVDAAVGGKGLLELGEARPFVKAPLRRSCAMSSSSAGSSGRCIGAKSRNGTAGPAWVVERGATSRT